MTSTQVTIVIVDDDEGHVELVRRNLRCAGINNAIVALHNGTEGLDYVLRRGVHGDRKEDAELLVLLDINMPGGLDGIEVLRRIKATPETETVPVIMLTTTDEPREIMRCYELGCNVYITKPVAPESFMEAAKRLGLFITLVAIPSDTMLRSTVVKRLE